MDNGNKPAMPSDTFRFLCDINLEQCNVGLTKREHFAVMAMQGIYYRQGHRRANWGGSDKAIGTGC